MWKEAKVVRLHKCDSKSDKNSYRPISVLPVLQKVFELHLHNFLRDNNFLYKLQSGFRKHLYSTETALMNIADRLVTSLDNNHVNGPAFTDFRTFDLVDLAVDHDILVKKLSLRIHGLDDCSSELINDFLTV